MLVKMFEEQVEKCPDQLAVKTLTDQITYKELNQQANRVAFKAREECTSSTRLSDPEITRYQRQMLIAGWGLKHKRG
jgi:non-ribosomal peptide synthetase component F